ncbi:MAG: serine--tRNA ligase [Methylobacterium sp.]|nr:serine--tRNA ligase [Methylobacterium sp.]MCA3604582.1 serine--tRNA ligase [Methylobacterium sp.]MCA3614029.1 serine--tRNA ligase [Methylobacterium sp.]
MHDLRALRANPDALKNAMLRRGKQKEHDDVAKVLDLDATFRQRLTEKETLLARRNAASKEIGAAMAAKDMGRAEALKAEVASGKERLAELEAETGKMEAEIRDILSGIPNIPKQDVPEGADEHGNVEYAGSFHSDIAGIHLPRPAKRIETGKDHVDLGEALGLIDFETAAKLSGSRFVVTKGQIARLERALGQFMLDLHTTEHGYTEVNPPILVKDDAMFGTAQLPKFREDQFLSTNNIKDRYEEIGTSLGHVISEVITIQSIIDQAKRAEPGNEIFDAIFKDEISHLNFLKNIQNELIAEREQIQKEFSGYLRGHWLIPTAEVPLTNLVREKILSEEELPLRFTALTPCFRAEAGSAGRDTRGMLRQHQFNKVELVSITTPEKSAEEHERMLAAAETVLKKLGLHYQVMTLCTGDMGFGATKTYDIEVWLPGQNAYREISSCSVCGDFQARRMEARYRPTIAKSSEVVSGSREDFASKKNNEKETRFVHTLNGSGVAVGRCLIAVIENYQNADGSITVPDVLLPYMGGVTRIEKA